MADRITAPPANVQSGGSSLATSQAQSGDRVGSTSAIRESWAAGTLREPMVNRMRPSVSCTAPMTKITPKFHQPTAKTCGPVSARRPVGSMSTAPVMAMRNRAFQMRATDMSVFCPQRSSTA